MYLRAMFVQRKKESGKMLEQIIATEHRNGAFNDIRCPDGDRLIVGYSDERAKKNAFDRKQGMERSENVIPRECRPKPISTSEVTTSFFLSAPAL